MKKCKRHNKPIQTHFVGASGNRYGICLKCLDDLDKFQDDLVKLAGKTETEAAQLTKKAADMMFGEGNR